MKVKETVKIEALYPLNRMQGALLFHHLSSQSDEGFIHIQCVLNGEMDLDHFKKAWDYTIERHEILRSTVHWENLEQPFRVVHRKKQIQLSTYDWTGLTQSQIERKLKKLKETQVAGGFSFQDNALRLIDLIAVSEKRWIMLWPTHHLLLDGWSAHNIVTDVLRFYRALETGGSSDLEPIPTYADYCNRLKQLNKKEASEFWSAYFQDFVNPLLIDPDFNGKSGSRNMNKTLSKSFTAEVQEYARSSKITLNTLFQTAWSIVLSLLFNVDDVAFGITVSGRSLDFPDLHLMSGMFMSVHPFRANFRNPMHINAWMEEVQQRQYKARNYEHLTIEEIIDCIQWEGVPALFDTLLVFENYPNLQAVNAGLEVEDLQSGLTSAYPITLTIIPGKELVLNVSSSASINNELPSWILQSTTLVLKAIIDHSINYIHELSRLRAITGTPPVTSSKINDPHRPRKIDPPTNDIEKRLLPIWKKTFGKMEIGINDNFFNLGGKSFMAIRLFSLINREFHTKLPPTTILQQPTICNIAKLLQQAKQENSDTWPNLVPIRASGSKAPLFCIHAGGGHVFFFGPLAEQIEEDRPVYAIQPSGLYAREEMHENISIMAKDYVDQITRLYPKGPFNLLVYCFSTAVGLEMGSLLKAKGLKANLIVVDSLVKQQSLKKSRLIVRARGFFKRLIKNPVVAIKGMITDRLDLFVKPVLLQFFGSHEKGNHARVERHLYRLYTKYHWLPYDGEVTIILTEKPEKKFNEETIRSWKDITNDRVNVKHCHGNHRTIFDLPDVRFLSARIEESCK